MICCFESGWLGSNHQCCFILLDLVDFNFLRNHLGGSYYIASPSKGRHRNNLLFVWDPFFHPGIQNSIYAIIFSSSSFESSSLDYWRTFYDGPERTLLDCLQPQLLCWMVDHPIICSSVFSQRYPYQWVEGKSR